MEFFRQFWGGIGQAWNHMSTSARVNIALTFLFAVAVIGGVLFFGSRPQYVTLFDGLSPDDMATVQARLADENVPYEVDHSRHSVLVPSNERSRMRVELLASGIPKSQGTLAGFESLGSSSFTQNQFAQQKGYQVALMGQLQRMLNEFSFVDKSFVQVTEGKARPFTDERNPSEATVTLKVNRPLKEEDIRAVLACVSSFGGADLTQEHITLVTVDGRILNAPSEDDFGTMANSQLAYSRSYKNDLERSAEEALRRIGVRSVVRVSLNIDNSSTTERTEEVNKGTLISSLESESSTESIESVPGGPPGARANLPPDAPYPGGAGTKQTENQLFESYEPSRRTVEKVTKPGAAEVVRVTAIVEGRYKDEVNANGNKTGGKVYVPRTKQELDMYKGLVATAAGVADENIVVQDHPFQLEQLAPVAAAFDEATTAARLSDLVEWITGVGRIVIVVVLLLIVRRFMLRAAVRQDLIKEELRLEIQRAGPEERCRHEIATEVERVSKDRPAIVASLLRTWLRESEE